MRTSKIATYAGLGLAAPAVVAYIFGYRATLPRVVSVCSRAWRTSRDKVGQEVGNWRNELSFGEALDAWMSSPGR